MKLIYKIGTPIMLGCSLLMTSCKKDFGTINDPWDNRVYTAKIPEMYNGIASSMTENGRGVFSSFLYQNTQLAANYAAAGFRLDNLVGDIWNNYYFALGDYKRTLELIEAEENPSSYTNVKAMLTTLIAYKTLRNTALFGDVPYTEAGLAFKGGQHYRPVYEGQESIFTAALGDLKWALDNFSTSSDQVDLGAYETLLDGDISLWIKFANSLRLRYAMVMREKNPSAADLIIADALTKPLLAPDEYLGVDPEKLSIEINRGPSFRGNAYVRMGSTIWEAMSSSNAVNGSGIFDLRARVFFEPNSDGEWKPYPQNPPPGTIAETDNGLAGNDPYAEVRLTNWTPTGEYHYSPLNVYYVNDRTVPDIFIAGTEVSFLKAEIYNRGIAGVAANAATAEQNYEDGIKGSVSYWYEVGNVELTPAALTAMLANSAIAYSATPADALSQIYKQYWISLFHQPFEAWTLKRRTNNATPNVPLAPTSEALNLNRLVYPTGEITSNYDNWVSVTGGTDDRTKKPWFMP